MNGINKITKENINYRSYKYVIYIYMYVCIHICICTRV